MLKISEKKNVESPQCWTMIYESDSRTGKILKIKHSILKLKNNRHLSNQKQI